MKSNDELTAERRQQTRASLSGTVTVRLPEQEVVGPGENVSADGVFFVAEAALRVEVLLPGEELPRRGELVRVTAMGEGRVGFAVRFAPAGG